ncbi:MAG: S-layer homology domain-containing protein [Oscillospiraceae bacterium]|nr:S-layer homology domain-containing protein [Oscillospiraceae bacterium]
MQKKSKKLLSLMLAVILILGLLPAGAMAEGAVFNVTAGSCVVIGTYMNENAYLYTGTVPEGAKQVTFTDFTAEATDVMSLTGSYTLLEDTNTAPLSNLFKLTKKDVDNSDSWELENSFANYSFENCLAFFLMDDDFNMATYVIVYESEPDTEEYDLGFAVTAGEKVLDNSTFQVLKDSYTYVDSMSYSVTVDTYVVSVPQGTENVTLTFPENRIAYNYTKDGTYLGGYYEDFMTGAATAVVPLDFSSDSVPADGEIDYIQVQTPYDAGWNTTVLYAITFRYEEPDFTVTVGNSVLDKSTFQFLKNSYSYFDYASNSTQTLDAYLVTVPQGTETVTLTFPENRLAYNYTKDGTYLGGSYDDFMVGASTAVVPLDCPDSSTNKADGVIDYIQVQTPYDADWNTTLLYAITFRYENGGSGSGDPSIPVNYTPEAVRDAIAARYAASGVVADPNGPWLASDMMAYLSIDPTTQNRLSDTEKQAIVDKAIDAIESTTNNSEAARYIITLAALGYDPTQLTTSDGIALNGKEKLDSLCFDKGALIGADGAYYYYSLPYLMIAYQQLNNSDEALAVMTAAALELKASWMDTAFGPDGLTPFLLALAPYASGDTAVAAAIQEAVGVLRSLQSDDGSVGNAASTGLAIAGLVAAGIDPKEFKSSAGKSLADGLLVNVSDTGDGFKPTSNSYSTEQGFRGLVALAHEPGYRIYDFKAQATSPAAATAQDVVFSLIPGEASVTVTGADGSVMTQTGRNSYNGLAAGTYSYTASLEGYEDKTGTFTITEGGAKQKISVSLSRTEPSNDPDNEEDTVTITVYVLAHDSDRCENRLTYKNNADQYYSILKEDSYTVILEPGVGTARDALVAAIENSGLDYEELSNGYFPSIGGYEEKTHSGGSGWLYMVDGVTPDIGAGGYVFTDDAEMVWFFTDNYTIEYGSEEYQTEEDEPSSPAADTNNSTGTEKPDETEAEAEPAVIEVETTVEDGVATATAEDKAVAEAAQDEEKGDVVLQVETKEDADTTVVELSAEAAKAVAEADKALVFSVGGDEETPATTVELDAKTLSALAEQGETVSVQFQKNEDGSLTLEVKVGEENAELAGGLKVSLPTETAPGQVLVVVAEDGTETVVRKSAVEDGEMTALLEGGATIKIVDNAKDFGDVTEGAWYADAVDFVSSHELFVGDENGSFNPTDTMSRAMMAMVMFRLEGEPEAGEGKSFSDVEEGKWYTEAINWASNAGVMNGYGESFGTNDPVTREQMALLLYNYVQTQGIQVKKGSTASFSDAGEIHAWAADAMAWAVEEGIFQGDDQGRLNPTEDASRADVAILMERVVKLLLK